MLDIEYCRRIADATPTGCGHLAAGDVARKTIHDLCDRVAELEEYKQRVEQQRSMKRDDYEAIG